MARVLVLQDDAPLRGALSVMLRALGHDPIEATDCTAAEFEHEETPCDLILVDLVVRGGPGLVQRLHDAHPELPILTTNTGPASDASVTPSHVVRQLRDPFNLGDLFDSVERALDQPLA